MKNPAPSAPLPGQITRRHVLLSIFTLFTCAAFPGAVHAQWNDSLLKPFAMDHRAARTSPADVSFLLDAPAGKNGFERIQGGHLVKLDGSRLRLWGVHLTDWSRGSVLLPSKEDVPMWAATLARFGVNCVRLHFLDLDAPRGIIAAEGTDSQRFDAQQLDRLDVLVSELKGRGIYLDLNLNVGRYYKPGDGVTDADRIRWGKGLVLFDPRLIALQKDYARQLLTHRNPYTNIEYRNEPAVAIVEILNENGLYVGFNAPTSFYDEELTVQYNAWLAKHRTPAEVQRLRDIAAVLTNAPVPRLKGPEVGTASRERYDAEMEFTSHVEEAFYLDMAGYLRDTVGVQVPLTGTANIDNTFASVVLTSLDSSPLSRAERMLLTARSRVSNSGLQWNAERTRTVNQGSSPSLIEPVQGTLTLRMLAGARAVSVAALDGAGNVIGPAIPATRTAAGWTFPMGTPVTTWYVIAVARRRAA